MVKQVLHSKVDIKKIRRFIQLLERRGVRVLRVILFGSYAQGKADRDSDIDLAIISNRFGKNKMQEMMLLRRIALQVDSHIEPMPFSPEDLEDHYSTFIQEIKRYGKVIKGIFH